MKIFKMLLLSFTLISLCYAQIGFPIKSGRIVFHRYTDWDNWDGKLFLYEFSTKKLTELSKEWTSIEHTCNAHFSPDGSKIVFMAVPKNSRTYNSWNIYLCDLSNPLQVLNLTPNIIMDQDPKFFRDGINICYKSDGDLKILNTQTLEIKNVTNDGWNIEESMPYPTVDGKKIIYSTGTDEDTFIYSINVDGTDNKIIENTKSVHSYYPIVRDDSTYIFTRGYSASNNADELYLANFNGKSKSIGFNIESADDSDSFPVDSQYVFFSSNRSGTKGGWDLFLGDIISGSSWTLSLFSINSSLHELGVCFTPTDFVTTINEIQINDKEFYVDQNFPNPFNSTSRINFFIPHSNVVKIKIINIVGQVIIENELGYLNSGNHYFIFESSNISSGVYFYQLITNGNSITKKCVITK